MPIPERFLDELIARTDIVDLVGEYVRLTKKGRNYWGLCPFHSEKTPPPGPRPGPGVRTPESGGDRR